MVQWLEHPSLALEVPGSNTACMGEFPKTLSAGPAVNRYLTIFRTGGSKVVSYMVAGNFPIRPLAMGKNIKKTVAIETS